MPVEGSFGPRAPILSGCKRLRFAGPRGPSQALVKTSPRPPANRQQTHCLCIVACPPTACVYPPSRVRYPRLHHRSFPSSIVGLERRYASRPTGSGTRRAFHVARRECALALALYASSIEYSISTSVGVNTLLLSGTCVCVYRCACGWRLRICTPGARA